MVQPRSLGFECPCHNSRYEPDGRLVRSAAAEDLRELRVQKHGDGNLHVFPS